MPRKQCGIQPIGISPSGGTGDLVLGYVGLSLVAACCPLEQGTQVQQEPTLASSQADLFEILCYNLKK
jgi:hypothetical protein